MGGVPGEILYDRMKTAVIGEDEAGVVTYNASLVALPNHYGAVPRACQPYRAKTKGKVERPFRYIRQDFFLARKFRNMDDLNAQFDAWRTEVANPRVHATTRRVVDEAFAEEQPSLKPLPATPYSAVLTVGRRVSKDGMISVGGNFYSVPDTTRRRTLEVQHHATELRIYEDGQLIVSLRRRPWGRRIDQMRLAAAFGLRGFGAHFLARRSKLSRMRPISASSGSNCPPYHSSIWLCSSCLGSAMASRKSA